MKCAVLTASILSAGLLLPLRAAPQELTRVQLHPWPRLSQLAAVSLTFDDAYPSHVEVAMPLLEERGFRGTFYVIVDRLLRRGKYAALDTVSLQRWRDASRRGHEIGSHTVSHVRLDTVATEEMQRELYISQFVLQVLFDGAPLLSLAYPYSQMNTEVVKVARDLYTSGRLGFTTLQGAVYNHPLWADFLRLRSLFLCSGEPASQWNAVVDRTRAAGGWLIETAHPIDAAGYCRVRSKVLSAHLDYLYERSRELWVAPVGSVVERLSRWRRVRVQAVPVADDTIRLCLIGSERRFAWWVLVAIDDPSSWEVVDDRGRLYPTQRKDNRLSFRWSSWTDTSAVLRRRPALLTAVPGEK